ncbi:hypothetical protein AB0E65_24775, partial [Streptomyces fragilis]
MSSSFSGHARAPATVASAVRGRGAAACPRRYEAGGTPVVTRRWTPPRSSHGGQAAAWTPAGAGGGRAPAAQDEGINLAGIKRIIELENQVAALQS